MTKDGFRRFLRRYVEKQIPFMAYWHPQGFGLVRMDEVKVPKKPPCETHVFADAENGPKKKHTLTRGGRRTWEKNLERLRRQCCGEIPALDRLCAWLENRDKTELVQQLEDEIVGKLKEAAEGGVPKPKFEEVPAGEDHPWKGEAKAQNEATSSVTADAAPPSPEGKAQTATLADVQKAAAQMRDEGRLNQVTGMFGEFGIKKLSDLKGDALQKFAERLRQMGAKV